MADLEKQLPAVINQTTTAVAKLEPRLEAVYNQLVAIAGMNVNFTKLTNNFTNMTNNFTKVNNVMKTTSVQSSKVISKVNNISLTMNSGAKAAKSYGNVFKSLASGFSHIEEAGKKIWSAIESTSDYMKVCNSYKDTFGDIASTWSGDYEKYGYENAKTYAESFTNRMNDTFAKLAGVKFDSENMQIAANDVKNLGLSLEDVTKCATDLANVTNSVGFSGEDTMTSASAFTKLAGDLSSVYDVDYSTMSQNMVNAIAGQGEALGDYKIDLSETKLQTYVGELGIEKSFSDMSQAEQMQLRMIAILKQSKDAWGNLAIAMEQPSVQISMLKDNFPELIQTLGQLFMPIVQKILPYINGITMAIKTLLGNIAVILGIKMESQAQAPTDMSQSYDAVSESIDEVADSAKKAKTHLLGIDELNVVEREESTGTSSSVKNGGANISGNLSGILGEYESMWTEAYNSMENKAQEFAATLGVMFAPVEKLFTDIRVGDWFKVGEDVSNIVSGIFNFFATAIDSVDWKKIGENIGEFLRGVNWTNVLISIGALIGAAIESAFLVYQWSFDAAPIETAIISAIGLLKWAGIGNVVKAIGQILSGGFKNETGFSSRLTDAFALTVGGAGTLKESMIATFGQIGASILGVATIIGGGVLAITNFFDMLSNGFSWLNEILMLVGIGLTAFGAIVLGAPAMATAIVAGIVAAVATLVVVVKDNWDAIVEWTSNLFDGISEIFSGLWTNITESWSLIATWFSESVIQPIVGFFVGFATRIGQVFEGLWIIIQAVWEIASTWFNENVIIPIVNFFSPIVDTISNVFLTLWNNIQSIFGIVSDWFIQTIIEPLTSTFKAFCDGVASFFSELWNGVKGGVIGAMNAVIGAIESGINFIVGGMNLIIGGFNKIVSWAAEVAEVEWGGVDLVPTVTLARIPTYEIGGFPEDGLFMTNHTELIGRFSNGKTAVANNEQIVSGIKYGVREAVSEVLAPYLADIAQNTRETANKDFATYIGDKEIARASERGRRAMGLQLITEF